MPHLPPPARTLPASGVPPRRGNLHRHRLFPRPVVTPGQARPLAGQDEALLGLLRPGMHRDALITSPDLHRALALPHLHRGPYPLPVDAVPGALPADETVPGHLAVLPQVRRQRGPIGQLPQVRPLLGQHLPRHPVGRSVHPRVGHHVAPLQPCRFRSASFQMMPW